MPELPEVETVRRGLEPVMAGKVIARTIARRPDLRRPLPERFAARMTGRRAAALRRRAKVLLIDLDGDETLLVHLGMSGRMIIDEAVAGDFVHPAGVLRAHDHVEFTMESGARIIFNDARRFGAMDLWPTGDLDAHPSLGDLGPEPLGNGFSPASLLDAARGRRSPLKAFLLDQRRVAGLGNIYVCEALWRARLSPFRPALTLRGDEAARLHGAIRDVLTEAIAAGGSSLRDHRLTDGSLGYFQHRFAVYGRSGEPCPACQKPVQRVAQSGRSTHFCAICQDAATISD